MKGMIVTSIFALVVLSLPHCYGYRKGFATAHPFGEKERAEALEAAVTAAAKTFLENQQTVSLSIGIIKDGETSTYNFGTIERGKQTSPTARTRYAIASITKTFTGALLAQAVVEKKVNLDDDVRKYLDGDYPNLEYQGQPVRLYQLIDHTSGLPRSLPENVDARIGEESDLAKRSVKEAAFLERYTRQDFFRDLHSVKLTSAPGEKFSYSNAAAQLLGLVLERVYGKSYEELLRIKITGPLKMNDTKVTLTPAETARLPKAYSVSGAFLPALSTRFPAAGSLKSTTADMLKYIAWQLAERDEAVRLSHQLPAGSTVWRQGDNFTVGLNWQILKSSGHRNIFQDGNVPGFHSMCVLCPELKLGIIVLTTEEVRSMPASLSPFINQILKAADPQAADTP